MKDSSLTPVKQKHLSIYQNSAKSKENQYSKVSHMNNLHSLYTYDPNNSKMLNISQFNIDTSHIYKERTSCDPIYGHIVLPSICWDFVDKFEFQRLRNLKQLGNSYHVFPGATHTRFEHCLGTAHLANLTFQYLSPQLINELDYDMNEVKSKQESVVLAGLLHDIGHGPFSHLFDICLETFYENELHSGNGIEDNNRLYKLNKHYTIKNLCEHEYRSSAMIDYMIDKYGIDIDAEQSFFIKNLILGGEMSMNNKNDEEERTENWIYQIIANKKNSIDVDKFDYLKRDTYMIGLKSSKPDYHRIFKNARIINNDICFNIKHDNEILNLFQTRYKQYKQIYYHKTTGSIDLMIKDALILSNSYFKYLNRLYDMKDYCLLDDNIIEKVLYISRNLNQMDSDELDDIDVSSISQSGQIIDRIEKRDFYPFVCQVLITESNKDLAFLQPEDICIGNMKIENILMNTISINYGNKDRNPFDSICFYKDENPALSFRIQASKISLSVPSKFTEKYLRIYTKYKEDVDKVKEGFDLYIKKVYGSSLVYVIEENEYLNKKRS